MSAVSAGRRIRQHLYQTNSGLCLAPFLYVHLATPNNYTLSLHDALPIFPWLYSRRFMAAQFAPAALFKERPELFRDKADQDRAEEHTSELQSRGQRVCRLLLEEKKLRTSRRRPSRKARAAARTRGRPIAP